MTSAPAAPIRLKQLRGTNAEVDPRHSGVSQGPQHPSRVGLRVPPVVLGTEAAGPRVEQLHDRCAGRHLRPQKDRGQISQPGTHRVPQRRLADHQGLCRRVVAARPALDEIAGQGERRASKADQGNLGELTGDQPDGFGDVPQSCRIQRPQLLQISRDVRTGRAITGPRPETMSRSTPAALSGNMMSEYKNAASTP